MLAMFDVAYIHHHNSLNSFEHQDVLCISYVLDFSEFYVNMKWPRV